MRRRFLKKTEMNKMSGRRGFYDLSLVNYKHHENREKVKFIKKRIFLCDVYNLSRKGRKNAATTHFVHFSFLEIFPS